MPDYDLILALLLLYSGIVITAFIADVQDIIVKK